MVEGAQTTGSQIQPLRVVSQGLGGLHLDRVVRCDRVVPGVGEQRLAAEASLGELCRHGIGHAGGGPRLARCGRRRLVAELGARRRRRRELGHAVGMGVCEPGVGGGLDHLQGLADRDLMAVSDRVPFEQVPLGHSEATSDEGEAVSPTHAVDAVRRRNLPDGHRGGSLSTCTRSGSLGQAQPLAHVDAVAAAESVQRLQGVDAGVVAGGDRRERLAPTDLVIGIAGLGGEACRVGQRGNQGLEGCIAVGTGHAQPEALGDPLGAVPDRVPQRGIRAPQALAVDAQSLRESGGRRIERKLDGLEVERRVDGQRAKVLLRVLVDLEGRQEFDVEVPRCEAERTALVLAVDHRDVLGAHLARRAAHARRTVVVGGQRQRPGAGGAKVVLEQLRGRNAGDHGVHALVHDVVHPQVAPACGARELPQPRCTYARVGMRREGRLDVGQGRELHRQSHVGEGLPDVIAPGAGPDQTGPELVRLAELEAQAGRARAQRAVRDVVAPQLQDSRLLAVESAPLAAGEMPQLLAIATLDLLDHALARARAGAFGEADHLVNDAEVAAVVDEAAVGSDLGIDA